MEIKKIDIDIDIARIVTGLNNNKDKIFEDYRNEIKQSKRLLKPLIFFACIAVFLSGTIIYNFNKFTDEPSAAMLVMLGLMFIVVSIICIFNNISYTNEQTNIYRLIEKEFPKLNDIVSGKGTVSPEVSFILNPLLSIYSILSAYDIKEVRYVKHPSYMDRYLLKFKYVEDSIEKEISLEYDEDGEKQFNVKTDDSIKEPEIKVETSELTLFLPGVQKPVVIIH